MKPSELSRALKKIASKIDTSRSPSKKLVLKDLKQILASLRVAAVDQFKVAPCGGVYSGSGIDVDVEYRIDRVERASDGGFKLTGMVHLDPGGMNSPVEFTAEGGSRSVDYTPRGTTTMDDIMMWDRDGEFQLGEILFHCLGHEIGKRIGISDGYMDLHGYEVVNDVATRVR